MPIALSVEYFGSQKIGFSGSIVRRKAEFDATPPENTTDSPGYCFRAFCVAARTACATLFIA
jgi:hypothetical protein